MAKIKLIEVKSDLGGRKAGASLGIDAIRIASYNNDIESDYYFYGRFHDNLYDKIVALNRSFHAPIHYPYCRRIENILPVYEQTCDSVANGLLNDDFTVVISGDHSTAGGTIAGMKLAYPDKRVGVIWIDAHTDVHTPYSSETGNMHGMPLATAINDDNIECSLNNLDSETVQMWERLKSVGGTKDKLNMSDVVYIAIRDYEQAEKSIIAKYNNKVYRTYDVRQKGAATVANEVIEYLSYCDVIYISFDVDSMDPTVSVGTGTPVEGGLYSYEANELLTTLVQSEKVKCLEISEINPILDSNNKMAKVAFNILKNICKVIDLRFA